MDNIRLSAKLRNEELHRMLQPTPPQWALDRIADRSLDGGYTKRNVLCPGCFVKKSTTGKCNCEEE